MHLRQTDHRVCEELDKRLGDSTFHVLIKEINKSLIQENKCLKFGEELKAFQIAGLIYQ